MRKEIQRFDLVWGTETQILNQPCLPDDESGHVTITACSLPEGWSTQTDFSFLALDPIVLSDFNRPVLNRLLRYLAAFSGFIIEGSAQRFFLKAWRFGLYFLYPFLTLVAFALLGGLTALLVCVWLGLASIAIGLAVFFRRCRSLDGVGQPCI